MFNPFSLLLNWRVLAAIALAAALAAALAWTHWKAYGIGEASVQADWDAERSEVSRQSKKIEEKRRADEIDLQTKSDEIREAKNAQINKLDIDLRAANERLRNRPERPSVGSVPAPAGSGEVAAGCTGEKLFRSDSEFLSRLARDADETRIALNACYQQYDKVRQAN